MSKEYIIYQIIGYLDGKIEEYKNNEYNMTAYICKDIKSYINNILKELNDE